MSKYMGQIMAECDCQHQACEMRGYCMAARIEQLVAINEELEAKLAKAVEEKLDAIDTLNAWFDRRELAHDAVDQAVVNAASGYLRISRVGGMSQKKSDLVLGVIQDMAHLSVFADLFARTTLAELSKERSEKG